MRPRNLRYFDEFGNTGISLLYNRGQGLTNKQLRSGGGVATTAIQGVSSLK